jgi:hypothetical protein
MGKLMQILLLLMMTYAAFGLIVSLTVHILSFFGIVLGGDRLFFALHVGIFPLWIPVVLIGQKITGGTSRKDFWKVMLSGCPPWMKYMTYGFFIYAIANFVIFIATAPTGKQSFGGAPPSVWHGFSGHWMAFYAAGLAISTSVYRRGIGNLVPRCPNGHLVSLGDTFCPNCGVRLGARPGQSFG